MVVNEKERLYSQKRMLQSVIVIQTTLNPVLCELSIFSIPAHTPSSPHVFLVENI